MDTLQKLFESLIQENLDFKTVGLRVVQKKFKQLGITLSESQLKEVEASLEHIQDDGFTIQIGDEQFLGSKIAQAGGIEDKAYIRLDEEDVDEAVHEIIQIISKAIPDITSETAEIILKQLKADAPSMLKEHRKERRSFESMIVRMWKKPLELMEMFLVIALEAGDEFNEQFRQTAFAEADYVFDVLTRLHARGCQIGAEVLALLKSGYADGAHARWRTLHEIAVVALFVAKHGNSVAERYICHDVVESYRAAKQYQEHCEAINHEPITEEGMREIENSYLDMVNRFGSSFKNSYGWASFALGKDDPTFTDIEKNVELEHFRPFYKLASHNVHANPKGITFKLGLSPDDEAILLAGASNTGFADPAHGTAISLLQITMALLTTRPTIDGLAICNILMQLEKEIGETFANTQAHVET